MSCAICGKPTPLTKHGRGRKSCSAECLSEIMSRIARANREKTPWYHKKTVPQVKQ